jgi:hypothetical protein
MMSLESKGLEHSLYSLDLVRCDFFLMQWKGICGDSALILWMGYLMLERAFWEGYLLMSCIRFFKNEYGTYHYALKAVENMLTEHHKTTYLLSQ